MPRYEYIPEADEVYLEKHGSGAVESDPFIEPSFGVDKIASMLLPLAGLGALAIKQFTPRAGLLAKAKGFREVPEKYPPLRRFQDEEGALIGLQAPVGDKGKGSWMLQVPRPTGSLRADMLLNNDLRILEDILLGNMPMGTARYGRRGEILLPVAPTDPVTRGQQANAALRRRPSRPALAPARRIRPGVVTLDMPLRGEPPPEPPGTVLDLLKIIDPDE